MSSNNTYKLPKRKKFRVYLKLAIWILFVISIFVGLIYWINHDSLKINSVEIQGNKFTTQSEIMNLYDDEVSGRHLFIFSRKNFLLLPENKIEDRIRETLLPAEEVFADVKGLHDVVIEVVEYKPVAIYHTEDKTYFVNKKGVLFFETPEFYVDDLVLLESNLEEGDLLGKQYTDENIFSNLIKTFELLSKENIKILKISTEDFETYTFRTVTGTDILIEGTDKPETTIENLQAALSQESIHEIQFNNIEYFDLRFEDKVFYKLK